MPLRAHRHDNCGKRFGEIAAFEPSESSDHPTRLEFLNAAIRCSLAFENPLAAEGTFAFGNQFESPFQDLGLIEANRSELPFHRRFPFGPLNALSIFVVRPRLIQLRRQSGTVPSIGRLDIDSCGPCRSVENTILNSPRPQRGLVPALHLHWIRLSQAEACY